MTLGVIAYASNTGLGYQLKDFCDYMKPERILLVDLSQHNKMPIDRDWYPEARYTLWPNDDDIDWLCEADTIFYAETPLNYRLHERALETNTKIIQQPNYEFLDYIRQPELPRPTLLAAPTRWNLDQMPEPKQHLQVPVNRKRFPYRKIYKCESFIHIVGRPAVHDRNGTLAFLEAIEILDVPAKVFIQTPQDMRAREFFAPVEAKLRESHAEIVYDHDNPSYIYRTGDVLVLPRRYGGLCLPMQEALSCGLPVVMTDISPNHDLLPKQWLCDATFKHKFHDHQHTRYAHVNVDVYEPDIGSLVKTMSRFLDDNYMRNANFEADQIANNISWDNLKPEYDLICR